MPVGSNSANNSSRQYSRLALLSFMILLVLFSNYLFYTFLLSTGLDAQSPLAYATTDGGSGDGDDGLALNGNNSNNENPINNTTTTTNNNNTKFLIQLSSRQFIPEPGIEITAIRGELSPQDRVHFLVQFESLPNASERMDIATTLKIALLDYVTGNTYIASSSVSDLENLEKIEMLRWSGPIIPNDKISSQLRAENIGDWALTQGGQVVLTVQFHSDVNISEGLSIVSRLGGKIISSIPAITSPPPEIESSSPPSPSLNSSLANNNTTIVSNQSIIGFTVVTAAFDLGQVQEIVQEDAVLFVDVVGPPLEPQNDGARPSASVTPLANLPYGLTGAGVTVLVYDVARIDGQHPDFGLRIVEFDAGTTRISDHATHVAGTVGGSGANSNGLDSNGNTNGGTANQWAGMAPAVNFRSFGIDGSGDVLYDSGADLNNDFTTAINNGIDIATMSLGHNVVRRINSGALTAAVGCPLLGDYANTAIAMDNIVRGNIAGQQLILFKSGSNERGGGNPCGPLLANNPFGTIGSPATAKNPIVVGAINSNDNSITGFTGFGPTDDGRLKPDITAPGCQNGGDNGILSPSFTDTNGNGFLNAGEARNSYVSMCGTSMATPVTTGSAALLVEQWESTRGAGNIPLPHTAKAILVHTATDLGNAGPDYRFGWGLLDAQTAVDLVRADDSANLVNVEQVDAADIDFYTFSSDGSANVRITLAWDDPAATRLAATTLVNDLDLRLVDPDGIVYQPFVLNPNAPANVATNGNDAVNNVEMVIGNAKAGQWLVRVAGTTVPLGPQQYTLVTPNDAALGDGIPPLVTGIPDRAPDVNGFYTHPVTITWIGDDRGGSGIASCDPPTTYSGPAGSSIVLTGHCTDNAGNVGTGTLTINYDNPPDCSNASPSPSALWPPNHRMTTITIQGVTDIDGDPITIRITEIRQDEPTTGQGSGDRSPDGSGIGTDTAQLRAERAGAGDGRVYRVGFTADDGHGVTCNGEVLVSVPHDRRGTPAVNSGTTFDSTQP